MKSLSALFAAALLVFAPLRAQEPAPPPPPPLVSPEADAVLRAAAAHYAAAPAFRVGMTALTRMEAPGMKQEFTTTASLAVKRPRRFHFASRNSLITLQLICDGDTLYAYMPDFKRYVVKPAPDSLQDLCRLMGGNSPVSIPIVAALLEADPRAALLRDYPQIRYVGLEEQRGVPSHRLAFASPAFTCDAWFQAGDGPPLLLAVKPSLPCTDLPDHLPPGLKAELSLELHDWTFGADLPDSLFAFQPAAEDQKVEVLLPALPAP